jgi:hypothetical protein
LPLQSIASHLERGVWNPRVLELALICLLACFGLGLAWAHDADFFAIFFAAAAAIAGMEAVRRSL